MDSADAQGHGVGVGSRTPLTVVRLVGDPAVLGILVDVIGVALGALLGPEVLVGPRTLLAVADLVLERGPRAQAASIGWAGASAERPCWLERLGVGAGFPHGDLG